MNAKSHGKYLLGIEIGGSKLQIVAGDKHAVILDRVKFPVDKERGRGGILENIERGAEKLLGKYKAAAIGVGFGGPFDIGTGVVYASHHIAGWNGFNLGKWIESAFGLPAAIDNDANTAALAEALAGAGRNFQTVFYVTLGSGCGGGLVQNRGLYHGACPGEAEIGLVKFDKSGANIESKCSGWAVDAKIRRHISENPGGVLSELARGLNGGEARFLSEAVSKGDKGAVKILDETAEDLAFGLSHVVHLFNPEVIILGGGLSLVGEILREGVQRNLPRFLTESYRKPGPQVKLSELGEDVVPIGALFLAADKCGASTV